MNTKKDIKTEIDRYLRYNYSKKDVIVFLKRDGFNESEIKENIAVFNKVDSNYFSNLLHFLPALLFLIFTTLSTLGRFYSEQDTLRKVSFIIISLVLVYFTIGFCRNKPFFILITSILISLSALYYSYVFFIISEGDEFGFTLSIPSKIAILTLHLFTLRGSYKMYKAAVK